MNISIPATTTLARLGALAALCGLVSVASAATTVLPDAGTPAPATVKTVLEAESKDTSVFNDRIESAQLIQDPVSSIQGVLSSVTDTDFYQIDVPLGHTLSASLQRLPQSNVVNTHQLRLHQSIALDAGRVFRGMRLLPTAGTEQWSNSEVTAPYFEGSTLDILPHRITLSRGLEEFAPLNEARNSTHYGLSKLSSTFYVQVTDSGRHPSPAGPYRLNLKVTAPATSAIPAP